MPELPEVETIKRELKTILQNTIIYKVKILNYSLRKSIPKSLPYDIEGAVIKDVIRKGKYIIIKLSGNNNLLIHLGMTGNLLMDPLNIKEQHIHVIFSIHKNDKYFDLFYYDPRRFGCIELLNISAFAKFIKNMGEDALSERLDKNFLFNIIRYKKTSIKSLLMNQKVISGIGNIYASEILFHAGLYPLKPSNSLTKADCRILVLGIKEVLNKAILLKGSSIKDFKSTTNSFGKFQNHFFVYNRTSKECKKEKCNGLINKVIINNRSTFFCPKCQKQ